MRTLSQIITEAEKSKKQKEYTDFFNKKLEAYGVKSPSELNDEDKKKFFSEIKDEWKGGSVDEAAAPGAEEVKKEEGDGDKASDKIEKDLLNQAKPTETKDGEEFKTDDQEITAKVKESFEILTKKGLTTEAIKKYLTKIVNEHKA